MVDTFSNNYETTLNGSISNVDVTLTVTSTTGAPSSTGQFRLLIKAEGGNTDEIVTVTGVAGSVFTISRATEAVAGVQTASAHGNGASVVHVLTAANVADSAYGQLSGGTVRIPGWSGSPDLIHTGADDDDFDLTDTSDPMAGWTTLGSPTHNINSTRKSRYYLASSAASVSLQGIYKAKSPPFTLTTCIGDWTLNSSASIRVGIFIGEAAGTGKFSSIANANFGAVLQTAWTNRTTFSANNFTDTSVGWHGINYLRIVATTSTNVAFQVSRHGEIFSTVLGSHNPGFTVAIAGLFINPFGSLTEATFDWETLV